MRVGSHDRQEIAAAARADQLRHSRDRVKKSIGRVQRRRHFLLYRTPDGGRVEIEQNLNLQRDAVKAAGCDKILSRYPTPSVESSAAATATAGFPRDSSISIPS